MEAKKCQVLIGATARFASRSIDLRPQKLALFLYERPSLWTSCEKINNNLVSLYQDFAASEGHELKTFFLDGSYYGNHKITKDILKFDPDEFVFIDHRLYPDKVLGPLKEAGLDLKTKSYIIHVFGHYALRMKRFEMIFSLLEGCKVNYRFPSKRFLNSFAKIFPDEFKEALSLCPVPVSKEYGHIPETKENKKKTILYAGRISPRKNCLLLIEACEILRKKRKDFELLLAGNFDNYLPYSHGLPGEYMGQVTSAVERIDSKGEYIKFAGFLEEKELIHSLNQANVFCSLSTMMADDYGLALAEAFVSGLPVVATDWGGYSQIMSMAEGARPLPVSYSLGQHDLNAQVVAQSLDLALDDSGNRKQRSEANQAAFSNQRILPYLKSTVFMPQPRPNKLTRIMESAAHNTFVEDRLYETIFKEVWESEEKI